MTDKDYLYIFLHVPKCAGSTFVRQVRNNFNFKETLNLYPNQAISHPVRGYEYFKELKDIQGYLELLDDSIKNKIKVIYGHIVYYGIHEYFNKACRYITFLRNPIERTLSDYNMGLHLFDLYKRGVINSVQKITLCRRYLDSSGKMIPFEEWINSKVIGANHLVRFFIRRKFFQEEPQADISRPHLEEAKEVLDKFYFVGITEYYDTDVAFLYSKLGIRRFYGNENVAKKYYLPKDDSKIRNLILANSYLDMELYDYAVKLNREFKKQKEFYVPKKYAALKKQKYFYVLRGYMKLKQFMSKFLGRVLREQ
ncbi:MAG: sulfotransferase family 2 domain-containing protein [Candidatus Omnitrophica bacterium]|nr:sulfotransferase family 2 domain-containing protein [Candidatus Omnitrophota bacterium]MDD5236330.1 sulfotransferase family 2 domain-containing protein [Candidatus Omnitrophota bacterium]MDD5610418.1 sulfotransferase family 2 domain-containing protein [Candidatus Omnitrophota bacterium]